jgi:hypothetical protein
MLRLPLIGLLAFGATAFLEAQACTLLESPFKPGSPEAIAEELRWKKERAAAVAESELVFVGKVVAERLPDLGEIISGLNGRFALGEVHDLTTGQTRPYAFIPGVRSWFEPVRMLKGKSDQPTTNIFSGEYGAGCGYGPSLKVGAQVLVFADKHGGYWFGDTAPLDILPYLEPMLR